MGKGPRNVLFGNVHRVHGTELVAPRRPHHRRHDLCIRPFSLRSRPPRPVVSATTPEEAGRAPSRGGGQIVLLLLPHEGRQGMLREMSPLLSGL